MKNEKEFILNNDIGNLLKNPERLHTTELGVERIKKNLGLQTRNVVDWCRLRVVEKDSKIVRQGKNWYITTESCIITINSTSFTIITAHKKNNS